MEFVLPEGQLQWQREAGVDVGHRRLGASHAQLEARQLRLREAEGVGLLPDEMGELLLLDHLDELEPQVEAGRVRACVQPGQQVRAVALRAAHAPLLRRAVARGPFENGEDPGRRLLAALEPSGMEGGQPELRAREHAATDGLELEQPSQQHALAGQDALHVQRVVVGHRAGDDTAGGEREVRDDAEAHHALSEEAGLIQVHVEVEGAVASADLQRDAALLRLSQLVLPGASRAGLDEHAARRVPRQVLLRALQLDAVLAPAHHGARHGERERDGGDGHQVDDAFRARLQPQLEQREALRRDGLRCCFGGHVRTPVLRPSWGCWRPRATCP